MLCSATPGMRFGHIRAYLNSKGDLPVRSKYLYLLLMLVWDVSKLWHCSKETWKRSFSLAFSLRCVWSSMFGFCPGFLNRNMSLCINRIQIICT